MWLKWDMVLTGLLLFKGARFHEFPPQLVSPEREEEILICNSSQLFANAGAHAVNYYIPNKRNRFTMYVYLKYVVVLAVCCVCHSTESTL